MLLINSKSNPVINLIGAGNLGKTIGYLFFKNQVATIGGVLNSSSKSSLEAIRFIGAGQYYDSVSKLPEADITLIATPDAVLPFVCEQLSQNPSLKPGSLVIHFSGILSRDALISVKEKACFTASVHPMRSFAKPSQSIKDYPGTYCAVEGDSTILPVLTSLFQAIGSIVYPINKSKKVLYHAAGVFASNYLITLFEQAMTCMTQATVAEEIAFDAIINLMEGSLSNLKKTKSSKQSLTGPIKRGEVLSIDKHLNAMEEEQRALYGLLGKATVALTELDTEKKQELLAALQRGLGVLTNL